MEFDNRHETKSFQCETLTEEARFKFRLLELAQDEDFAKNRVSLFSSSSKR
jgi:hypothetical protein